MRWPWYAYSFDEKKTETSEMAMGVYIRSQSESVPRSEAEGGGSQCSVRQSDQFVMVGDSNLAAGVRQRGPTQRTFCTEKRRYCSFEPAFAQTDSSIECQSLGPAPLPQDRVHSGHAPSVPASFFLAGEKKKILLFHHQYGFIRTGN